MLQILSMSFWSDKLKTKSSLIFIKIKINFETSVKKWSLKIIY